MYEPNELKPIIPLGLLCYQAWQRCRQIKDKLLFKVVHNNKLDIGNPLYVFLIGCHKLQANVDCKKHINHLEVVFVVRLVVFLQVEGNVHHVHEVAHE